ncbi:hypothetical protein L2E82_21536 [Cichorium intybus]|uniref:Uncharacterized protein n=1 Tax=Cichorium intybus TaxID=13427 RepID=A0ACB9DWG0_CICIN|nr:hypothetical protein L2E82_21536 [Cichorium intybus]
MGRRKNSSADNPSRDRENCKNSSPDNPSKDRDGSWKNILKGYVDLVQEQQRQLESLLIERKSLEKRIRWQHDRWDFDVKLLEFHISKMMRSSKEKDMFRVVDTAKANLIISMEQKKAIIHKLKFEEVEDERADLKLLFEELSQCFREPKHVTRSNSKNFDESALKAERDFAWNQFKKTDAKLQEHKSEVEAANNKIQKLISELEQSQSLNMEKNKTISALQDDMAVLESDSRKKSEEISRLTKELELLRGDSNNRVITPILRRCNVESSSHSSDMAIIKKGDRRSSKRKGGETEPRLFTSRFKVPKLKQLST